MDKKRRLFRANNGAATDLSMFNLDSRATLIPRKAYGGGTPTFTRATTATVVDFEGRLVTVPLGATREQGARFVRNYTTDNVAAWGVQSGVTITSGVADKFGGTLAFTITATAPGSFVFDQPVPAVGERVQNSMYVRRRTGSGSVSMGRGGQDLHTTITTAITTDWRLIAADPLTYSSGGSYIGFILGASGDAIDVCFPLSERPTGQTNQNVSERVSRGTLAAPYHGAGIDGVKYFTTENGNTVASNVVTEATGAAIADSTLKGYLSEPAGTQILATADIRDMTTASWTLGATLTRARTSVGYDGVANSATRLTGGAVAATNRITATTVAAASSRTYSAAVKRVTGTGPVLITQDNFATSTDISSSLVNGSWVIVSLTQSQLNAVYGFQVSTSTDAIDVDCNQFEAGAVASSRMLATGAARNADVLSFTSSGNFNGTTGTIYAEGTIADLTSGLAFFATWNYADGGGNAGVILRANITSGKGDLFSGGNGATSQVTTANSTAINTTCKIAASFSGTTASVCLNGGAVVTGTFSPPLIQPTTMYVGGNAGANQQVGGTVAAIRLYSRALSAAQLIAMTT